MIQKIENYLRVKIRRYTRLKSFIKTIYQAFFYVLSDKKKVTGNIVRVSPNDEFEYFFGYYDKSPWDITDRFILCLRVENACNSPAPDKPAEIIMIDTHDNNSYCVVAKTYAWNSQMGCRVQWLGPDFNSRIIYNDFRDGNLCSVILDINSKNEKIIDSPVYDVSANGAFALTLDFVRLHRLRPGYGYSNLREKDKSQIPNEACIYKVDLIKNEIKPILSYSDLYKFENRSDMTGADHKVNHIMINPNGKRFMMLHRWISSNGEKYTRLVTADSDGNNLYNQLDDDFTSHMCWKNDNQILAFANKAKHGEGYFLLTDKSEEYELMLPTLITDGHPSYSPDGLKIVTDTYPNRSRKQALYLNIVGENTVKNIGMVFSPFKYTGDVRCDLHPRWNRHSDRICFDGTFEGKRRLYIFNDLL